MNFAAIDIGSNAIRLLISESQGGIVTPIERVRTPIRLGQDVFDTGLISDFNISAVCEAFNSYQSLCKKHNVKHLRATATSAVRESLNSELFTKKVLRESGVKVDVIDAFEEARLIHIAVTNKLILKKRNALLMDIGGGSVELIAIRNQKVLGISSFKMGTVRALKKTSSDSEEIKTFIYSFHDKFKKFIETHFEYVDVGIGTGGNIECMSRLRGKEFDKKNLTHIRKKEIQILTKKVMEMPAKQREKRYDLKADRTDVIVPALLTVKLFLKCADIDTLEIPKVGLRDGITLDLISKYR